MIQRYNGSDRRLTYLFDNANHVEVDPIQTAGIAIADITIDGDTTRLYAPQGGSGADVEANPSGTPTADLDTIRIGQVIYDIPGSGGGGGQNFSCKLIFKNDPLPTKQNASNGVTRNYTLGESIDNYDALYLVAMTDYSATGVMAGCSSAMLFKDDYYRGTNNCISGSYSDGRICYVIFPDSTHVTSISWANNGYDPILYAIYGIKFASNVINNNYLSDYYSEDERVVGRWTDGKPLYQKTWSGLSYSISMSTNWINFVTVPNGINLIKAKFYGEFDNDLFEIAAEESHIDSQTGILESWFRLQSARTVKVITLQYTKTTDQPGTGPTQGNIIYLPSLYSEEEREVGVWIDGKPLYQKTVKWSSVPNGRVDGLAHNIQDVDYIHITEWVYANYVVGHETSDQQYWAQIFSVNSTGIYYRFGPGWGSNLPLIVTFQYTKTTDQPGSGTWTPEGQLAHHFSNTEKVIGTWVDGSTLYEITLPNVAITSVSSIMDIYTNLNLGINKLVSMVIRVWKSDGDADGDMVSIEGSYKEMTFYYRKSIDSIRMEQPYSWMAGRFINATIQYTKT